MFLRQIKHNYHKVMQMLASGFHKVPDAEISFFHNFMPAPTGGGHQFLHGLWREFEKRGIKLENNSISRTTRACLFNSFNFDLKQLRWSHRPDCRMIHRVDGPLAVYRGVDDGTDDRIFAANRGFADATIFQSRYSLMKHRELKFDFVKPVVIPNATDPFVFHARGRLPFSKKRKIKLISVSWSDNVNKGAPVYQWLDERLDWGKYEYTFVGRLPFIFNHIRALAPVTSEELAKILRQHDIFITASRNDPCSNALIEALACGLPALYLNSGGHPEIVGEAGHFFETAEDIPALIDRAILEYESLQAAIKLPGISDVADRYLDILLGDGSRPSMPENVLRG